MSLGYLLPMGRPLRVLSGARKPGARGLPCASKLCARLRSVRPILQSLGWYQGHIAGSIRLPGSGSRLIWRGQSDLLPGLYSLRGKKARGLPLGTQLCVEPPPADFVA